MSSPASLQVFRALGFVQPGTHVTADTIRQATHAAGLRGREVADGLRAACRAGYVSQVRDGNGYVCAAPSEHPTRKGGLNAVYRRTHKPIEVQP